MPTVRVQDHDVQEDKILLVSLLMAEMGVHSVAYAFPQVKIITTAVDKKVNHLFHIIPGIGEQQKNESARARASQPVNGHVSAMLGNFGDRYFGTDAPPDWSDEDMDEPSYWPRFGRGRLSSVHWLVWCSICASEDGYRRFFRSERADERTKFAVTLLRF